MIIFRHTYRKLLLRHTALIGALLALFCSSQVNAEKYFTWVDEMGRVNHTVIPEEENPLIKPDEKVDDVITTPLESESALSPTLTLEKPSTPSESSSTVVTPPDSRLKDLKTETTPDLVSDPISNEPPEPRPESKLESELSTVRKVEINEADYIDGDVLLQQGNVRDENDLPYYTWTDEQGIVRNTPYRPEASKNRSEKTTGSVKAVTPEPEYTVHEDYRRTDPSTIVEANATKKEVDGFAQALFFGGQNKSFIDTFSNNCCIDLPKSSPSLLSFEDSVYIEIEKDTPSHLFSEGKSSFKLIELPHLRERYSLKLKTFIKSSSKTGVKNGVFFPQIVFLDDEFQVLRIIRNPVLEYVPENWRRHGYLKGLFEIDGSDNARYILINTTKENLKARNRIENKNVVVLSNQKLGSLELQAVRQ